MTHEQLDKLFALNEKALAMVPEAILRDRSDPYHTRQHLGPSMTDWREHLTPEEAQRLVAINEERRALTREYRRIFDRARKRASR